MDDPPLSAPIIMKPFFVPCGTRRPLFTWLAVKGADHYEFRFKNVTDDKWLVGNDTGGKDVANTCWDTECLSWQLHYQFSVRAVDAWGAKSEWAYLNLQSGHCNEGPT